MSETSKPKFYRRKRRRPKKRGRNRVQRKPKLDPIDVPAVIESAALATYCRDCRQEVKGVLKGQKMTCSECEGNAVAIGTAISIRNYFRLNNEGVPQGKGNELNV
jgi:hypothetical protein